MAVDASGSIYVADGNYDRIDKFDANGNHLDRWCVRGGGPWTASPLAVAVDAAGNVFVADSDNACIVKFSPVASFTLDEGQKKEFPNLAAGAYYVGELTIDRWTVSEIDYGGSGSGGNGVVWGDGVHITLGVDDVVYAFTNSDTIAPTVTIWSGSSTTSSTPINFTAVFSEPVTGFTADAVTLSGTAGATTAVVTETTPNDGTTYTVAVSGMAGSGTVTATVAAAVVQDTAGNLNQAATPATATYDPGPTVTIIRAAGQTNPTTQSPINFTVVFSQPVTGFQGLSVSRDGTDYSAPVVVTEIAPNDGTKYNVAVTVREIDGDGTVSASLNAGSVKNAAGVFNQAPSSTDNDVAYYGPLKVMSFYAPVVGRGPTVSNPINFIVSFNKPVTGFSSGAVTLGGTAGAKTIEVTNPWNTDGACNAAVSGMTGPGTVIVSLGAGLISDAYGIPNEASTSDDNTVTYAP